jgi:predicted O-methyltransferase YrrM
MSVDHRTGALLATLAASKPAGRFLEIGTGTGAGAAWLLSGMDQASTLTTIEVDTARADLARHVLGDDQRVTVVTADAAEWLTAYGGPPFDLAFVDWRVGKFDKRPLLVAHLAPGGLYVGDDLLPQPTWPADHAERVEQFLTEITAEDELVVTLMAWASGLVVAARRPGAA